MTNFQYTFLRLWSIIKKEFIQVRRDLNTYIFLIIVPLLQVVLFGFIINTNAKNLPTVVVSYDSSPFTNSIVQAFVNTGYFSIKKMLQDQSEADALLKKGDIQFIINIPPHFSHDLVAKKHPKILLEGDGTDPLAVINAFNAAGQISLTSLQYDLKGPLQALKQNEPSFSIVTHAQYNPELLAQYHTLPGLLMTMLTIIPVMLTAISITAEYELGTMELLLVTPLRPLEVVLGKLIPHIIVGYIIFFLTLGTSYWLFHVPFLGSVFLCALITLPLLISHLGIGLAVSTISKTQFQAGNTANLYFLPAFVLSGFMFPYLAMPSWAQWLGELLPPAHYLRMLTNIMLKGASFIEIWPDIWPVIIFMVVIIFISFRFYRLTLD